MLISVVSFYLRADATPCLPGGNLIVSQLIVSIVLVSCSWVLLMLVVSVVNFTTVVCFPECFRAGATSSTGGTNDLSSALR